MSPDLIRLMRGLAVDEPEPSTETVVEVAPEEPVDPTPAISAPHETISLRVDGARPLAFRGAYLCGTVLQHAVQDGAGYSGTIRSHLNLFGAEDGRIIAHIAATPGAGLSARPIYRAADVWVPTDLAAFVQTATGDVCFGTTPPGHHRPGLTISGPSAEQCGIRMPLGSITKQEIAQ